MHARGPEAQRLGGSEKDTTSWRVDQLAGWQERGRSAGKLTCWHVDKEDRLRGSVDQREADARLLISW